MEEAIRKLTWSEVSAAPNIDVWRRIPRATRYPKQPTWSLMAFTLPTISRPISASVYSRRWNSEFARLLGPTRTSLRPIELNGSTLYSPTMKE